MLTACKNLNSKVYDQLFNSGLKNEFEIYNIKRYAIDNFTKNKKFRMEDYKRIHSKFTRVNTSKNNHFKI